MKLYVLEERAPAEQEIAPPQVRRRSRVVVVGGAIAVLLGAGGLEVEHLRNTVPESSIQVVAQMPAAVVTTPAVTATTAPTVAPATPLELTSHLVKNGALDAEGVPTERSSIVRKGGKFVVDLHAVDVSSALAMMSQATRTTVVGADALRNHPARLTAKLTVTSPQSAWQSVFGDIANFAVSCVAEACVVHIVSAVGVGELQAHAPLADQVTRNASAPIDGAQSQTSIAASVAAVQQQQTTYTDDY